MRDWNTIFRSPVPAAGAAPGAAAAAGGIPFVVGSNLYREAPFFSVTQTLDGNSHDFVFNITPGGFLRGVVLQFTSASGVLGTTASLVADSPYSIISSASIEDISGGPILNPMNGFAHKVVQKYFRPWDGDPSLHPGFSNSINPVFTLRMMVDVRDTLAVLANTDARAQYRIKFTLAPLVQATNSPLGLVTSATGVTAPAVTVKGFLQTWSQPDMADLIGNPIDPTPPGLDASRFLMHETPAFLGGNNTIRHNLVGNELRAIGWIIRDSTGARVNLTDANAGAIDFRLDNRRLWKMNQSQVVEEMAWFYEHIGNGVWSREAGVYVIPRFRDPGRLIGEYWLQTVEQSLLQAELNGSDLGSNVPGSIEIIYDELAIPHVLAAELEGL